MTTSHHPDCDGFVMHSVQIVKVSSEGRGMWTAGCPVCPWTPGITVGPDGLGALRGHGHFEPCPGRVVVESATLGT